MSLKRLLVAAALVGLFFPPASLLAADGLSAQALRLIVLGGQKDQIRPCG